MATSREPESPTLSTPESVAIPPRQPVQRPRDPAGHTPAVAARTWLAIAIKLAMVGAVLHGLAPMSAPTPESLARPLLHGLAWCCWAGGLAALAKGRSLEPSGALDPLRAVSPPTHATLALGTIGVVGFGALLRQAAGPGDPAADAALRDMLGGFPGWAIAGVFVLLPAVGEEAFFRGTALRLAARRVGAGFAAIGSAVVFAAFHPGHPVSALAFGLALAALALVAGRTREAIVAHAAHNALGLAALTSAAGSEGWPPLAWAGAGCLVAASAWALIRAWPATRTPPG